MPITQLTWDEWVRSGEWQAHADSSMPMLPAMAQDVMRVALDPEVSPNRLMVIVQKDPVLATGVIRLANSAFSAPAGEITSISEAIVRIGTRAVRNVVTAVCFTSRVRDPQIYGTAGRALIDHAIGAAYLAWSVAECAGESPDEAFVYGLLHDIGKLLILKLAHDFRQRGGPRPDPDTVNRLIAEVHAAAGGRLLRGWKMPEGLSEAVAWHHDPDGAGPFRQAAAIAHVADRFAHRYGFGCDVIDWEPLEDPVARSLGITAEWLTRTDSYVPGLFDVARRILD